MLATQLLPIMPQTKSGLSLNSIGPGWRPQIIRPPRITAAVGEPGMPSVIIGSSAQVPAPCAAASGARTPATWPLPYSSISLPAPALAKP
jgi:hypothetical protein